MIPAFLAARYGPAIARLIVYGIAALAAILLAIGTWYGVKHYFTGGLVTEVKVTGGQLGAARVSGSDAVNTIGNVMGNEQAIDGTTSENENAIDNAPGASAAVDLGVRSAGLHALCNRKSYRDTHPACVQHAAAH